MVFRDPHGFWRQAFAIQGSITPYVLPYVLGFGAAATCVVVVAHFSLLWFGISLGLAVSPFETAGAVLAVLLVLRTNAGYDRWWEARKLWGGIVNQSRNAAVSALAYGPNDPDWRNRFVRWTAVFGHVAKCSLRDEGLPPAATALLGAEEAARVAAAAHMPNYVAARLAGLLREACERHGMDRFAFLQIDRERAALVDHLGGCERILNTPLPRVYDIKIRRFIALFLLMLPFALLQRLGSEWLTPIFTMLVAYPLTSLDQSGVELQYPFARDRVGGLPLGDIVAAIEANLMALLESSETDGRTEGG